MLNFALCPIPTNGSFRSCGGIFLRLPAIGDKAKAVLFVVPMTFIAPFETDLRLNVLS